MALQKLTKGQTVYLAKCQNAIVNFEVLKLLSQLRKKREKVLQVGLWKKTLRHSNMYSLLFQLSTLLSGLTGEWLRYLSERVWLINQNAKLCLMELPVYPVPFSVVRIAFFAKQPLSDFTKLSPFFNSIPRKCSLFTELVAWLSSDENSWALLDPELP